MDRSGHAKGKLSKLVKLPRRVLRQEDHAASRKVLETEGKRTALPLDDFSPIAEEHKTFRKHRSGKRAIDTRESNKAPDSRLTAASSHVTRLFNLMSKAFAQPPDFAEHFRDNLELLRRIFPDIPFERVPEAPDCLLVAIKDLDRVHSHVHKHEPLSHVLELVDAGGHVVAKVPVEERSIKPLKIKIPFSSTLKLRVASKMKYSGTAEVNIPAEFNRELPKYQSLELKGKRGNSLGTLKIYWYSYRGCEFTDELKKEAADLLPLLYRYLFLEKRLDPRKDEDDIAKMLDAYLSTFELTEAQRTGAYLNTLYTYQPQSDKKNLARLLAAWEKESKNPAHKDLAANQLAALADLLGKYPLAFVHNEQYESGAMKLAIQCWHLLSGHDKHSAKQAANDLKDLLISGLTKAYAFAQMLHNVAEAPGPKETQEAVAQLLGHAVDAVTEDLTTYADELPDMFEHINLGVLSGQTYYRLIRSEVANSLMDFNPTFSASTFTIFFRLSQFHQVLRDNQITDGVDLLDLEELFMPYLDYKIQTVDKERLRSWTKQAVQIDDLQPIQEASNLLHSSSVVDVYSALNQAVHVFGEIGRVLGDKASKLRFWAVCIDSLQLYSLIIFDRLYSHLPSEKTKSDLRDSAKKGAAPPAEVPLADRLDPRLFAIANDLSFALEQFPELEECFFHILPACEEAEKISFKAYNALDKRLRKCILLSASVLAQPIRQLVDEILLTPRSFALPPIEGSSLENLEELTDCFQPLKDALEATLVKAHTYLYESPLILFLKAVFQMILDSAMACLFPFGQQKNSKDSLPGATLLYHGLDDLVEFFSGGGELLPLNLLTELADPVKEAIKLLKADPDELQVSVQVFASLLANDAKVRSSASPRLTAAISLLQRRGLQMSDLVSSSDILLAAELDEPTEKIRQSSPAVLQPMRWPGTLHLGTKFLFWKCENNSRLIFRLQIAKLDQVLESYGQFYVGTKKLGYAFSLGSSAFLKAVEAVAPPGINSSKIPHHAHSSIAEEKQKHFDLHFPSLAGAKLKDSYHCLLGGAFVAADINRDGFISYDELKRFCASTTPVLELTEARNLTAADFGGLSDPYVKVEVRAADGKKRLVKTKVIPKELNPKWREAFELDLGKPADLKFHVEVWDQDFGPFDDPLGNLDLTGPELEKPADSWFKLTGKGAGNGEICMRIAWVNALKASRSVGDVSGKLMLADTHLCFCYKETSLAIPWNEVTDIKMDQSNANRLEVVTEAGVLAFSGLVDRANVYDRIREIRGVRGAKPTRFLGLITLNSRWTATVPNTSLPGYGVPVVPGTVDELIFAGNSTYPYNNGVIVTSHDGLLIATWYTGLAESVNNSVLLSWRRLQDSTSAWTEPIELFPPITGTNGSTGEGLTFPSPPGIGDENENFWRIEDRLYAAASSWDVFNRQNEGAGHAGPEVLLSRRLHLDQQSGVYQFGRIFWLADAPPAGFENYGFETFRTMSGTALRDAKAYLRTLVNATPAVESSLPNERSFLVDPTDPSQVPHPLDVTNVGFFRTDLVLTPEVHLLLRSGLSGAPTSLLWSTATLPADGPQTQQPTRNANSITINNPSPDTPNQSAVKQLRSRSQVPHKTCHPGTGIWNVAHETVWVNKANPFEVQALNWSAPLWSPIPDSHARTCWAQLPDRRPYLVGNQVPANGNRYLMTLAVADQGSAITY